MVDLFFNPRNDILRFNAWIMDTALRGNSDNDLCPLTIEWKKQGHYLIAYICSLENDTSWYRVFRTTEMAFYERDRILNPTYTGCNYVCLYDSMENREKRTLVHCSDGTWCDDLIRSFEEL